MIKSKVTQALEMYFKEHEIVDLYTDASKIAEEIVNLLVEKHIINPVHVVRNDEDRCEIVNGWKPEGKK